MPSSRSDLTTVSSLAGEQERTAARSLATGVSAMSAGMAAPVGVAAAAGAGRSAAWARSGESGAGDGPERRGQQASGQAAPEHRCSGVRLVHVLAPPITASCVAVAGRYLQSDPRQGLVRPPESKSDRGARSVRVLSGMSSCARVERSPAPLPGGLESAGRERGGTGRRAGFRSRWLRPWGFESLRSHQHFRLSTSSFPERYDARAALGPRALRNSRRVGLVHALDDAELQQVAHSASPPSLVGSDRVLLGVSCWSSRSASTSTSTSPS
jgi:hypothetical protein